MKKTMLTTAVFLFATLFLAAPARGEGIVPAGTIGPFAEDLGHVQGLCVASDTVFITSVDRENKRANLWKYDRATASLIKKKDITDLFMFHPSGLQCDEKSLWLAVAVYSEKSSAKVLRLDPATLKTLSSAKVPDHIGAVAAEEGIIYGANWDAEIFYKWNEKGKLVETLKRPGTHGFQDCKLRGGTLVCSGGGAVDFINTKTWKIEKTFQPGDVPNGDAATREGMDIHGCTLYFLPSDGKNTSIYLYDIPAKDCPFTPGKGKP